jgi:hypothetical protein
MPLNKGSRKLQWDTSDFFSESQDRRKKMKAAPFEICLQKNLVRVNEGLPSENAYFF